MDAWKDIIARIDAFADLDLDADLVARLQRAQGYGRHSSPVHFYTPTFKNYANPEIASCGKNNWPAISITGGACKLACDHCQAKILEPMLAATSPARLWELVQAQINAGAQGMLLSGGSNHRNEVEYGPYFATLRRIKNAFPTFKIALHTALVDWETAQRMQDAGIDAAMMDVIGAQDTITQVYHLKRGVADFERSLENLVATSMHVVPHIVLGLHYGHLLGEWQALAMIQRHLPSALVLVVVMPIYAKSTRPFKTPDAHAIGRFFLDAKVALPHTPLLLGCARPPGLSKMQIDAYAMMAGLTGIAHPSEGIVELANQLHAEVKVSASCCSLALGEEIFGTTRPSATVNARAQTKSAPSHRLDDIAVVLRPA